MIVGLSGYARSGKDEASRALQTAGFTRVAFADTLRHFLYKLNPLVLSADESHMTTLQDVIIEHGWSGYKDSRYAGHVREYLQRLGADCGRDLLGDDVWVKAAFKDAPEKVVVTDVRFPNEAQFIRDKGGMVIRLTRPGVSPANAHVSETALDDWEFDAWVDNDSTIPVLHSRVLAVVFP